MSDIPVTADLEGQPVELPPGSVVGAEAVAVAAPKFSLWPYAYVPSATALVMPISVGVMRSASRRKCSRCHRRRIVYWLEATSGWHGASPALCSACSGLLVHGGRHDPEDEREVAP